MQRRETEIMSETEAHRSSASSRREQAIREFVSDFADCEDRELLEDMLLTVCRLASDGTGRGELKILSKALAELRYAFKVFAPYAEVRKVSMFGSARTPMDHPDYLQADRFARRMREQRWMVITGAGDGIMHAGHVGAGREGSFGVAIRLPFEQATNPIIAKDAKLINFKYFFTRKLMFLKEASAVALFPGGFGTQDEGFEALTLVQTGKNQLIPIVLVDAPGGTYWPRWRDYVTSELLGKGMISPEDMNLLRMTDDVETAVQEVVQFYRVYHSSRYVRNLLVLRLNEPLSEARIEKLNDEFKHIITTGQIEPRTGPIEGEEGEYPDKPRLTLHFDRKSIGYLRLMIDEINEARRPPAL
jgi:uncharacterized protein (TIGR00730 family)